MRFIPAYAGNTVLGAGCFLAHAVHPRIRGEHYFDAPIRSDGRGSSPHTRGTHFKAVALDEGKRFIPAYAGNTVRQFVLAA